MSEHDMEIAAQEMALHMAMCVNAEYIHSWGLEEFLSKMIDYVQDEHELQSIENCLFYLENK